MFVLQREPKRGQGVCHNQSSGDEEDGRLGDFIEDRNAILPIDAVIQSNLRETTTRVLASLTPREERVLRMRFGIGMNTEEVGQQPLRERRFPTATASLALIASGQRVGIAFKCQAIFARCSAGAALSQFL